MVTSALPRVGVVALRAIASLARTISTRIPVSAAAFSSAAVSARLTGISSVAVTAVISVWASLSIGVGRAVVTMRPIAILSIGRTIVRTAVLCRSRFGLRTEERQYLVHEAYPPRAFLLLAL